eukprot:SAG22_NODE_951_length_6344_cov_2.683747_2_plen_155_part_00
MGYAVIHGQYGRLLFDPAATHSPDYSFRALPLFESPASAADMLAKAASISGGGGGGGLRAQLLAPLLLYLGLVLGGLVALYKADRLAAFGLAWTVGTFLPAANIFFPVATGTVLARKCWRDGVVLPRCLTKNVSCWPLTKHRAVRCWHLVCLLL